jgi:hypothetical protein
MCLTITGVNWHSFHQCKKGDRPIVFCLEGVMVRVMIGSCSRTDNGWQVEMNVLGDVKRQGKDKKVELPGGSRLKGILIKKKMAPDKYNFGWLEIMPVAF